MSKHYTPHLAVYAKFASVTPSADKDSTFGFEDHLSDLSATDSESPVSLSNGSRNLLPSIDLDSPALPASQQPTSDRIRAWAASISSYNNGNEICLRSSSPTACSGELVSQTSAIDKVENYDTSGHEENRGDGPLFFTSGLSKDTNEALSVHDAFVQERHLVNPEDLQAFLAQCSSEALEDFFASASDARSAASLRQSAILLDLDYWMRKVVPLVQLYQEAAIALEDIDARIARVKEECSKRERCSINLFRLDNRLPGSTRFPASFSFVQRVPKSRIENELKHRPWSNFPIRHILRNAYDIPADATKGQLDDALKEGLAC